MRFITSSLLIALAALSVGAAPRRQAAPIEPPGTFSILGFDPTTGEIGAAVQSRVFSVGNGVILADAAVGAVATQAIVNVNYGPRAMALLQQGMAPADIIKAILAGDPDETYRGSKWQKAGRQFAVMNTKGEVAAYTGPEAPVEFGDAQGKFCSAQGNTLGSKDVPGAMVAGFEKSEMDATTGKRNHLSARLVAALEAGQAAGGDRRGQESAALIVVKKDCGVWLHNDVELHLQVDDNTAPIAELRRLVEKALARGSGQIPCFVR